jgi:hypothetical protein
VQKSTLDNATGLKKFKATEIYSPKYDKNMIQTIYFSPLMHTFISNTHSCNLQWDVLVRSPSSDLRKQKEVLAVHN